MVTFFVIVMGPYPAASSATISPPSLTTVWAAAKPRHGAARPQPVAVLASDPKEDTKARWAASAGVATTAPMRKSASTTEESRDMMSSMLFATWEGATWEGRVSGVPRFQLSIRERAVPNLGG